MSTSEKPLEPKLRLQLGFGHCRLLKGNRGSALGVLQLPGQLRDIGLQGGKGFKLEVGSQQVITNAQSAPIGVHAAGACYCWPHDFAIAH